MMTESSILCDFCNSWIHPKCSYLNILNFLDFEHISGNNSDPLLCYKCTSEDFYKSNKLESTFTVVKNLGKTNIIGCIYRHSQ